MYNFIKWFIYFATTLWVLNYFWKKRWHYYYGSKFPGPFSLPLIGSLIAFTLTEKNAFSKLYREILQDYPEIFRMWMGPDLYISITQPNHVETILNTYLEKPQFYDLFNDLMKHSLLSAPVTIWKKHRKIINPTFNINILNRFHDTFLKNAEQFTSMVDDGAVEDIKDLQMKLWKCTLDGGLENFAGLDPSQFQDQQKFISILRRGSEIIIQRLINFWLMVDTIWKFSSLYTESEKIKTELQNCCKKVIQLIEEKNNLEDKDELHFLPYLLNQARKGRLMQDEIINETILMFEAGTETTASTVSSALLALGLHPEIQEKIHQELCDVLGTTGKQPTLEEINKMQYLDRVVKETLRLFPALPFILRLLTEDLKLDSYVLPKGCTILIPIFYIHRKPELWPDPLKFDPDRFLPEETKKRHRCASIPFSIGTRNCIGFKYGTMAIKAFLATIVQNFRIKAVGYSSVEEIDFEFHVTATPRGCNIVLEKRYS